MLLVHYYCFEQIREPAAAVRANQKTLDGNSLSIYTIYIGLLAPMKHDTQGQNAKTASNWQWKNSGALALPRKCGHAKLGVRVPHLLLFFLSFHHCLFSALLAIPGGNETADWLRVWREGALMQLASRLMMPVLALPPEREVMRSYPANNKMWHQNDKRPR